MAAYTIYKGPAQVEFGGYKFQSQGEITVNQVLGTTPITTDAWGTVDERKKNSLFTVSFTPSGENTDGMLELIQAAAVRLPGQSVMGGSLVIKPYVSGQGVITLDRAGITGLPAIRLGAARTLYGAVTFSCLETAGDATGIVGAVGSYSAPTNTFDPANIFTDAWKGTLAPVTPVEGETELTSFFTDLETVDGWDITPELSTNNSEADSFGICDITQTDFKLAISCKPIGLTETQFMAIIQRSGTGRSLLPGESLAGKRTVSGDYTKEPMALTLTSRSGRTLTISHVGLKQGGLAFGSTANRTPVLQLVGLRSFNTGAMLTMFSNALSDYVEP